MKYSSDCPAYNLIAFPPVTLNCNIFQSTGAINILTPQLEAEQPATLLEKKRTEKTTPFGVKLMRSQVLYRAAQGLRGIKVVLARLIVPPVASSLQRISNSVT